MTVAPFVGHFMSVDIDDRRALLHQLLRDWCAHQAQNASGTNHAGALHALLSASAASPARLDFLRVELASWLTSTLGAGGSLQSASSRVAASYLSLHPDGCSALASALASSLAASSRVPSGSAALHTGIRTLAATSQLARASLVPALIEARAADLLHSRHDFALARGVLSDVEELKSLSEHSPYYGPLCKAFPCLEQPTSSAGEYDVPEGFFD